MRRFAISTLGVFLFSLCTLWISGCSKKSEPPAANPRPVNLAVLAVLPRQLLRLSVDPIEYRQAVDEPPQSESESLGARSPAFIRFLHGQIIGGLERRRKLGGAGNNVTASNR